MKLVQVNYIMTSCVFFLGGGAKVNFLFKTDDFLANYSQVIEVFLLLKPEHCSGGHFNELHKFSTNFCLVSRWKGAFLRDICQKLLCTARELESAVNT